LGGSWPAPDSMSDAQSSHVPVGTVLEGKFRVTQEIGRGGMAAVYEAENIDIGKRVAVKILSAELITSRVVRERFIREARAAAAIHSPYICEVYDSGMYHERPFLVMELLDGESLYDRMTRVRQLKVSTCLKVLRHIVRGLAKAHQAGVVHRDLKPENIFLTRDADGRMLAKIVDFGLAKFYEGRSGGDEKNIRLTREGALFGTPAYMSPEQAKGQGEVDHRADLWALGCIVYECLTGRTVWDVQQGVAMILAQIAKGELPDPRKYRPDLPEEFTAWFKKALHPNLEERFQSGREFIESLEQVLTPEGEPISSADPPPLSSAYDIPDPAPHLTHRPSKAVEAELAPGGTSPRAIAWLVLGSASVLAGFTFWLYVIHPPGSITPSLAALSDGPPEGAELVRTREPVEKGPGAELINRAQKQFRVDQHKDALLTLELAKGENPNVAGSLIRHAQVALEETGACRLAGLGHPRPFDAKSPASHARIAVGAEGILAVWTDSHQDPKRRNVYSALLDDALRRVSPVRNATPEAASAIHPALTPLPEGFATLYWDSASEKPGVYVRSIQADGRINSPAQLLSEGKKDQYYPTLAVLPSGDLLAVWNEKPDPKGRSAIVARKLDRKQLAPLGSPVALTALRKGEATQPFARVFGDTLYIAYRYLVTGSTSEIRLMRIPLGPKGTDGSILDSGVKPHPREDRAAGETVVLRTQPRQAEPSMVCDNDGCLVVWDDEGAGAYAGYVPQNQDQPLWHREFATKGKRPAVARSARGQTAVAFFAGDRLFIAPVDRDGIGKPSVISRVSGFQPQPSLVEGTEAGEWLVAWRDYEAGQLEVFVARAHCTKTGDNE
jgi:eukaryotic-like serine/threonine-protein kinase